jgi:hypothetical protein
MPGSGNGSAVSNEDGTVNAGGNDNDNGIVSGEMAPAGFTLALTPGGNDPTSELKFGCECELNGNDPPPNVDGLNADCNCCIR